MAKKRRRRRRYELNHCIVSLRLIEKEVKRVRQSLEGQRDQDATSSDSDSASAITILMFYQLPVSSLTSMSRCRSINMSR